MEKVGKVFLLINQFLIYRFLFLYFTFLIDGIKFDNDKCLIVLFKLEI